MSSILKVDTIQNTGGTTGLTIDSNGFVLPKAVAFSAYMSGTQSISASTWTKVTFNTEEYDTASQYDHSNSKFQPTIAGYYQINAALAWMDGASTAALSRFYKNASNYKNSAYLYHGSQALDDIYKTDKLSNVNKYNDTGTFTDKYFQIDSNQNSTISSSNLL